LYVLEGSSCSTAQCIGANRNNCGNLSRVTFAATAGRTYFLQVGGDGQTTTVGQFRLQLLCGSGVCAPPNNVAVSGVTNTTATVSYVPVSGSGTTFEITWFDTILSQTFSRTVTGSGPITLTGLYPGTTYWLTVATYCTGGGTSNQSTTVPFTTTGSLPTTCNPPGNLTVSNITDVSAVLNFSGYARATSYLATYQTAGGTPVTRVLAPGATIAPLLPGTTYTVSVQSQCPASPTSAASNTVTFTTLAPPCNPPYGAQAFAVMPNSAEVSFVPRAGVLSTSLSWQPTAGGAVQTRSGVTSPFSLSGLAPNTSYTVNLTSQCSGGRQSVPETMTFTTPATSPPNDLCANATELTCGTFTFTMGTTVGAGRQGDPTGTCGGVPIMNSGGVFYKFTAPYDGAYSIGTCYGTSPTSYDSRVHVYTGTCGALTCVGGSDNAPGCGTRSDVSVQATAGTTYYVLVTGTYAQPGTFQLSLYCAPPPPCPLPSGLAVSAITDNSAALSFTSGAAAGLSYTVTYQATGGAVQTRTVSSSPVVLTGLTPGSAYTWSVRTTCTGNTPSAVVNGPAFRTTGSHPSCPAPTNLQVPVFTSTTATVLFDAGPGNYQLTYQSTAGGAAQTITANSSPVTLTGLVAGRTYTLSLMNACANSTQSAAVTTTFTVPTQCAPPGNLRVSYTTPTTASLVFDLSGLASDYLVEYQAVGGPWINYGTFNPQFLAVPYLLSNLQPSTRYVVRLSSRCPGYTPASASAVTSFVTQPLCSPVYDVQATNLTPTSATLSAATLANPPNSPIPLPAFQVTYQVGTTGPVQTINTPRLPVQLTALLPGTTYRATVVNTCAPTLTAASTTFTTPAANTAPINDLCSNAVALPCGVAITGSTVNATTAGDPSGSTCGGLAIAGPGVFYRFRATNNRQFDVSTCGTATQFDTRLHVFRGSCGRLVCVGSNDNACGTASRVQFAATVDSTYYILVSGAGGATGTFGLLLTGCLYQTNCDLPNTPTISQLTPTSALLSFAPALGATQYRLEYQAFNGPISRIDAAGSPIQLSGLIPNTVYTYTLSDNCPLSYPRPLTFTTPAGTPCPVPPAVTVTARTATTATISFAAASAPAVGYTLLAIPATGTPYVVTPTPTTSPTTVTGLTSQNYTFELLSNCAFGSTSPSRRAGIVSAARATATSSELMVYPNPSATGELTVQWAGASAAAARATLYNSLGQAVRQHTLSRLAAGEVLPVRGLAAGLYTLLVQQGGQLLTQQVVLE